MAKSKSSRRKQTESDSLNETVPKTSGVDVPLVYIRWDDHFSFNTSQGQGWVSVADFEKMEDAVEVYTVGFLLAETEKSYKIGLSVSEEGYVNGNITILKRTVNEFKILKVE